MAAKNANCYFAAARDLIWPDMNPVLMRLQLSMPPKKALLAGYYDTTFLASRPILLGSAGFVGNLYTQ